MNKNLQKTTQHKAIHKVRRNPPQFFALGFLGLIAIGTILLMLPMATTDRHQLSLVDAFFEAASAVCVTGLVVVDTKSTFTLFGQIVILSLIQIGGWGFMSFGVFIALVLRKNIGFNERSLVKESFNQYSNEGIIRLVKFVLIFTVICELIGTIILGISWADDFGYPDSLYYGLFHSISAFNNAGFDLMGDYSSMTGYTGDLVVTLTLTTLLLLGGIGFIVILDVIKNRSFNNYTLHTKLVLFMSGILIFVGSSAIFLLEYSNPNTLGGLSLSDKLTAAYFHGVVPRTAGFNSLDMASLTLDSQLITMMLMFIGGGSGGTAGGIKVTTFVLIILAVWGLIKGNKDVNIFKRRIPEELIFKAFSIATYSAGLIGIYVFVLALIEDAPLNVLLFEIISAFGTVGLSMGLTPDLSETGKVLIALLMFMGRVGPITVAFAIAIRSQSSHYRNAQERIIIG